MEHHQPEIYLELEPGYKIGKLTFERAGYFKPTDHAKKERYLYLFKCECGNSILLTKSEISIGLIVSCGHCSEKFRPFLPGDVIGELTVLSMGDDPKFKKAIKFKCSCGKTVTYTPSQLKNIRSCGHLSVEGNNRFKLTHGETHTRLYNIWDTMRARCYRPSYKNYDIYGGRGITVCEEWNNSYESFRDWAMNNDYKDDLTIERIDVNGNYEPSNCKWITWKEQARNKRNTIYINGRSLAEICEERGLSRNAVYRRINDGWDVDKALNTPFKKLKPYAPYGSKKK